MSRKTRLICTRSLSLAPPEGRRFIAFYALLTLIMCPEQLLAEDAVWSGDTAYTNPKGRVEVNLTTPSQLSLAPGVDLLVDLPLIGLNPNVGIKHALTRSERSGGLTTSVSHRLSTPSIVRKFYVIEEEPFALTLESDLLASARALEGRAIVTLALGAALTSRRRDAGLPVVEELLLYPRVGNEPWMPRARVRWDAHARGSFYYIVEAQMFIAPRGNRAQVEQRVELSWRRRNVYLGAGALLMWRLAEDRVAILPTLNAGVAID